MTYVQLLKKKRNYKIQMPMLNLASFRHYIQEHRKARRSPVISSKLSKVMVC